MKLYNIYRGSKYKLSPNQDDDVQIPPDALDPDHSQSYRLGAIDGMYSWSIGETDGKRYYFAAWTEVELIEEEVTNE